MHRLFALSAAMTLAACATRAPSSEQATAPRLISMNAPLTCAEQAARALADSSLQVDQVPAPLAYDPPPVKYPVPRAVARIKDPAVAIEVLVDTLGKADMSTFRVVTSSHQYYTDNLKAAVAKWTFAPATIGGCKVPRVYKFGFGKGAKAGADLAPPGRAPAKAPAKAPAAKPRKP